MNINIKKIHEHAVIPQYAKGGDAGMDLVAVEVEEKGNWVTYRTGLALEIPDGFVGLLFPRSSIYRKNQRLANSVGVIDSGYRGEIMFKFSKSKEQYEAGERIGQIIIMPYPKVTFEEVDELATSDRGIGGFGSTGV